MSDNSSLLGFDYQAVIDKDSGKAIEFHTTIEKNCDQSDIDALLDKCRKAVTRQQLFAELDSSLSSLNDIEVGLSIGERALAISDARAAKRAEDHTGRSGRDLSSSEAKDRQDKVEALILGRKNRENLLVKIEAYRGILGEDSRGAKVFGNGKEGAASPFLG